MMPTGAEAEEVVKLIETRLESLYRRNDGVVDRDGDPTWSGEERVVESIDGTLSWADLNQFERLEILEQNVTWTGFTPEQELDVIGIVISGEPRERWMDGVLIDRQDGSPAVPPPATELGETLRELNDPRADHHAEREIEAWYDDYERAGYREMVLNEAFQQARNLGFVGFREQFFAEPEALKEWPDPEVRERELRSFWDAQGDFDQFAASFKDVAIEEVERYRDQLRQTPPDAAFYSQAMAMGRSDRPAEPPAPASLDPALDAIIAELEKGWTADRERRAASEEVAGPESDDATPENAGVRPLTEDLILCCQLDVWPKMATVLDFGIDSSSHLGALQFAIREELVSPQELDGALGNGAKLTEIAQRGDNPYRDVTFRTAYDDLTPEPPEPFSNYELMLRQAARRPANDNDKDRGPGR